MTAVAPLRPSSGSRRTASRLSRRVSGVSARSDTTVLVVVTALYTMGRLLQDQISQGGFGPVFVYDERFRELKAQLPTVRTVGYVSDWGPLGMGNPRMDNPQAKQDLKHYFQARYALAPTLVLHGITPEYVVGDFSAPPSLSDVERSLGLHVVHDFGNGVVLFRGHDQ